MFINQVAALKTRFDYFAPWNTTQTDYVKLGEDDVIAVILDDNAELVEWITEDAGLEFVANVATQGKYLIYLESAQDTVQVQAAISERALYADCFA